MRSRKGKCAKRKGKYAENIKILYKNKQIEKTRKILIYAFISRQKTCKKTLRPLIKIHIWKKHKDIYLYCARGQQSRLSRDC
jgi:rhodanese-related sulfurtransferase